MWMHATPPNRRPWSRARAVVALTLLAACGPLTTFSARGGGVCPKRESDCRFEVISSRPAREFQVIGVIDIEAPHAGALPRDEAAFRRAIGAAVCRAGGDAVIPGINGDQRYVLATVVKWVDAVQSEPVCPLPDAGSDAAAQSAAAAGPNGPSAPREDSTSLSSCEHASHEAETQAGAAC
jgi:hypothetical protein